MIDAYEENYNEDQKFECALAVFKDFNSQEIIN